MWKSIWTHIKCSTIQLLIQNNIRQLVARLLLGLLVLMQINSVVFRHAHRLANGQIISHAHPYNLFGDWNASQSCPLSPNPHTTHELLLLDAVSNPAFIPAFTLLVAFLLLARLIVQPVFFRLSAFALTVYLARPIPRGPPVLSSSRV